MHNKIRKNCYSAAPTALEPGTALLLFAVSTTSVVSAVCGGDESEVSECPLSEVVTPCGSAVCWVFEVSSAGSGDCSACLLAAVDDGDVGAWDVVSWFIDITRHSGTGGTGTVSAASSVASSSSSNWCVSSASFLALRTSFWWMTVYRCSVRRSFASDLWCKSVFDSMNSRSARS